MANIMNSRQNRLDAHIFYILPDFIAIFVARHSVFIDISEDGTERTLVTHVSMSLIFVLDETVCIFVDSVIGQMHAKVV